MGYIDPIKAEQTRRRIIAIWQENLAKRIGQIATRPGVYHFTVEVTEDGRKLFRKHGEDEVLGR